jgi:short-subunit dehydrogenase
MSDTGSEHHVDTRRTALISGASSGIGEAFTTVFADGGFDLIISWTDPATVAQRGYAAVMAGRPLEITGRVDRTAAWVARVAPRSLLARVARR